MFCYAQINDDNVVIAISQLREEINQPNLISIVDYNELLLGKIWNGSDFDNAPIVESNIDPYANIVTRLQFLSLFTETELQNILTAAKNNVQIEVYVVKLQSTEHVDLTSDTTINALNSLESIGLLDTGRVAQILSNTPPQ